MKPSIHKDEYHYICLCKNGKQISKGIAVLVAQAFIPNPEHLPTVDHINKIRDDNRVSNLRHVTQSQQAANRNRFNNKPTKGCYWHSNKWRAQICINYHRYHLGRYETEQEAANIYDFFCWLYYKEFAVLNTAFPRAYPPAMREKIDYYVNKYGVFSQQFQRP